MKNQNTIYGDGKVARGVLSIPHARLPSEVIEFLDSTEELCGDCSCDICGYSNYINVTVRMCHDGVKRCQICRGRLHYALVAYDVAPDPVDNSNFIE